MNNSWLLATFVSAAMIFTTACEDPNETGLGVLPQEDLISGEFIDTFEVELKPVFIDSVNTLNATNAMMGVYTDPEFGDMTCATYTQFKLIGTNLTFGNNPSALSLDSIVLSLDLDGYYGRFDDVMQLQVHEIKENFPDSDTLWSSQDLTYDAGIDYANGYEIDFRGLAGFKDFITVRLDDSLGWKFLHADTDSLADNIIFPEFFKGLRLSTLPADASLSREPGGVFYLDLISPNTSLTIYYKDSTSAQTYTWNVDNSARKYHTIHRSNAQTRFITQVLMDSVLDAAPYSALQAGGLIRTKINIPGLKNFPKTGINRAELILPVATEYYGSSERFAPPSQVLLYAADSTGNNIQNLSLFNSSSTIDASTDQYTLPLTNTVMQILDNRLPAEGFFLVPALQSSTLNRAILNGEGHPTNKPRLKIIMTKLPE